MPTVSAVRDTVLIVKPKLVVADQVEWDWVGYKYRCGGLRVCDVFNLTSVSDPFRESVAEALHQLG